MDISILISTLIFTILTVLCMLIAWRRADGTLGAGLQATWHMFRASWLLITVAWLFAGYVEVLLPRDFVAQWLGREAGWKAILLACAAGAVTPGGPYVAMPIVAALYRAGVGEGALVAYLTAWSLYAFGRLPFEIGFMGLHLSMIRLASVCIFPPLAGVIAKFLFER